MTDLHRLYSELSQSPWIDDLQGDWLVDGTLRRWIDRGVRGVTSNPTTFGRSVGQASHRPLVATLAGHCSSVEELYSQLELHDVGLALHILEPVYARSGGHDGFVSLELPPELAWNEHQSVVTAEALRSTLDAPNLLIKVPATPAGVRAVRDLTAAGHSVNVTLLFSLERYEDVVDAYLTGLESCRGDLSSVHSVASFFVSRVDAAVNRELLAHRAAPARLANRAGIAQARMAYQMFWERFSGRRWGALRRRGANMQRLLWASTGVKSPDLPPLYYVEQLIGPNTVCTMPPEVLKAAERGVRLTPTLQDAAGAQATLDRIAQEGIDMEEIGRELERDGVDKFRNSYRNGVEELGRIAPRLLRSESAHAPHGP